MSARYIGAEKFREGKGIVAGIADSNLPEPLHETVRQMKKLWLSRLIQWFCPCPPSCFSPRCFTLGMKFARCVYEKPELGDVVSVESDEMWRFLKALDHQDKT